MKLKSTLLIIGLALVLISAVARLKKSDILDGSTTEIIATFSLVIVGLAIIGFFAVRSVKAKLKYVSDARAEYQAAYMCMIQSDPINTYIVASTANDIKIISNDKKKTAIFELKKQVIDIAVADVSSRGIRKCKGIVIAMKPEYDGEKSSTELVLLNDKKLLTPPLGEDALAQAVAELSR